MSDEMKAIEARFRSGNAIPIERTHITASEFSALQQQLAAAREALRSLERDAARYRWLRDNWFMFGTMVNIRSEPGASLHRVQNVADVKSLDAAIDATLQRDR